MLASCISCTMRAQIVELEQHWWVPNGTVHSIAEDPATGIVYVGGDFPSVSPPAPFPFGADIDSGTGVPNASFARPDGAVRVAIPDGADGWYIGGEFQHVDGQPRGHVAHLLANGSLDAWAPSIGNTVRALLLRGDTLLIGGNFGNVGGVPRDNLAAVSITTGALLPWAPHTNNTVRCMVLNGTTLYVGGTFTQVLGQARNRIAAMNVVSGSLLNWDPNANAAVSCMAIAGSLLYTGGNFSTIGGESRDRIAAISTSTANANMWDPGANAEVKTVALSGSYVYAGGAFTTFGGASREHLARVTTGDVLGSWDPAPSGVVDQLKIQGTEIWISGDFTEVFGVPRWGLACLGIPGSSEPSVTAWSPLAGNGGVECIAVAGGHLYAGGSFSYVGTLIRYGLVALDGTTGAPTAWDPGANGIVRALAIGDDAIYAGGDFTACGINMPAHNHIAALDKEVGLAEPWNNGADGQVLSLIASGTTLFVGGDFSMIGGALRENLASLNAATGIALNWDIPVNADVERMLLSGDTLYISGLFTTVGAQSRGPLASVLTTSPTVTLFMPNPTYYPPLPAVHGIARSGNTIYATGYWGSIGGVDDADWVSGVDATTGMNVGWEPENVCTNVAIAANEHAVYFPCTGPGPDGVDVYGLHGYDPSTGASTGFVASLTGNLNTVVLGGSSRVFIGGSFTNIDGHARERFAVLHERPAIRMKAILQGPWVQWGLMRDDLRTTGVLPLSEPYTAMGYAHVGGGGGEVAVDSVLNLAGNDAAVDWVVVELRSAVDPSIVVATRSALLQRDGDLMSGTMDLVESFAPDPDASYYIALRHRNHLGVMTASALPLKHGVQVDLSHPGTPTYGVNARWDQDQVMIFWAGDVNRDGVLKYTGSANDRDPILVRVGGTTPNNSVLGYLPEDVNLSGWVKYTGSGNDRDPILVNVGSTAPTNTRSQQLP